MIFFHWEARNCMFHYLVSHDEKCTAWAARLAHGVDYHAQLTHHRIVPARVGWWDALEREHREARGWKHGAARSGGSPVILSDGHEWNSHTKRNLDGLTKWKQLKKKRILINCENEDGQITASLSLRRVLAFVASGFNSGYVLSNRIIRTIRRNLKAFHFLSAPYNAYFQSNDPINGSIFRFFWS